MTLGGAAKARLRLIVWWKNCQHQLERQFAGPLMERRALAAVVIAVVQRRSDTRQQRRESRLSLHQRPGANVVAVKVQKVEDEIHQPGRVAGIRRGLDMLKENSQNSRGTL
jgi:hypothetical protein